MKKLFALFVCSAAIVAASPVTVSFVDAGTPAVVDSHGYDYVGPYTLNVNGQNTPAMCMDDFLFTSGTWTANVTAANSADLSNTYLGNKTYSVEGFNVSSSQIYQAEAYLYSEIVQPGADRIVLQDAAWTIMDYVTGHTPHSNNDPAVNAILGDAVSNSSSFDASSYEIISETNPGVKTEQEFMTSTPEPASYALLGGSLLLLGMTRIRSRKRERTASAS